MYRKAREACQKAADEARLVAEQQARAALQRQTDQVPNQATHACSCRRCTPDCVRRCDQPCLVLWYDFCVVVNPAGSSGRCGSDPGSGSESGCRGASRGGRRRGSRRSRQPIVSFGSCGGLAGCRSGAPAPAADLHGPAPPGVAVTAADARAALCRRIREVGAASCQSVHLRVGICVASVSDSVRVCESASSTCMGRCHMYRSM